MGAGGRVLFLHPFLDLAFDVTVAAAVAAHGGSAVGLVAHTAAAAAAVVVAALVVGRVAMEAGAEGS